MEVSSQAASTSLTKIFQIYSIITQSQSLISSQCSSPQVEDRRCKTLTPFLTATTRDTLSRSNLSPLNTNSTSSQSFRRNQRPETLSRAPIPTKNSVIDSSTSILRVNRWLFKQSLIAPVANFLKRPNS